MVLFMYLMGLLKSAFLFLTLGAGSIVEYDCGYWIGRWTDDGLPPENKRGLWVSIPKKLHLYGVSSRELTKELKPQRTCLIFVVEGGKSNGDSVLLDVFDMSSVKVVRFIQRKGPLSEFEVRDIEVRIKP